jgi:hypothetical protein
MESGREDQRLVNGETVGGESDEGRLSGEGLNPSGRNDEVIDGGQMGTTIREPAPTAEPMGVTVRDPASTVEEVGTTVREVDQRGEESGTIVRSPGPDAS